MKRFFSGLTLFSFVLSGTFGFLPLGVSTTFANGVNIEGTAPAKGEVVVAGSTYDVLYSVDQDVSKVRITVTGDADGEIDSTVTEDAGLTGKYAWSVPDIETDYVVLSLEALDANGNSIGSAHLGPFSIGTVASGGAKLDDKECAAPKVRICHRDHAKSATPEMICVSDSATKAHLDHGDTIGECQASAESNGYRWRNDDGDETAATAAAEEDVALERAVIDQAKRLRFRVLAKDLDKKTLSEFFVLDAIGRTAMGAGAYSYVRDGVVDQGRKYAYVVMSDSKTSTVARVDLASFSVVAKLDLDAGLGGAQSLAIDPSGTALYVGISQKPSKVVKVDLGSFTAVGTLNFSSGEDGLYSMVIDPAGEFAYAVLSVSSYGKIVKINLKDFTRVSMLSFTSDIYLTQMAIDPTGAFGYVGGTFYSSIAKIDLKKFAYVSSLKLNKGERALSLVADPSGKYAYAGSNSSPGLIVRIDLEKFVRVDAVTLSKDENIVGALAMDSSGSTMYAATNVSPAVLAKIDLATFKRVGSTPLSSASLSKLAVVSGSFVYVVTEDGIRVVELGKRYKNEFTLEHAAKSGSCAAVKYWNTVPIKTTTGPWQLADSSYLTDGERSTNVPSVLRDAEGPFFRGRIHDKISMTRSVYLANGEFTEVEYSIKPTAKADLKSAYCFRITNAGTPASYSTTHAEVTLVSDGKEPPPPPLPPPDLCGDDKCDATETAKSCPADCKAPAPPAGPQCGNKECEVGETSLSCPADCKVAPLPTVPAQCGNNLCETAESETSCPADCKVAPPPSGPQCGNDSCEVGESSVSCPADCKIKLPPPGPQCGNDQCEVGEAAASCPADCKVPVQPAGKCGNNLCEVDESKTSCPADCKVLPPPKGAVCGDNLCEHPEEDASRCPADCKASPPPSGPQCGNQLCETGENQQLCPADCKVVPLPTGPKCGNSLCEIGETSLTCSSDCKAPPTPPGPQCGDDKCDATESNAACPADCPLPPKPTGPECGNATCEDGETSLSCPIDCRVSSPPTGPMCGNNLCEIGEDPLLCPIDCKFVPPAPSPKCGNDLCEVGETKSSCAADCKVLPPPTAPVCGDNVCASTETTQACPTDCKAIPLPKGPQCGNDLCEVGESATFCSLDCKAPSLPTGPRCGNNICELGEDGFSCHEDCMSLVPPKPPTGDPLPPKEDIGLEPPAKPLPKEDLEPGSTGPGVKTLCEFLRANGYPTSANCDVFDDKLADALESFQEKYTDDGELGMATLTFLNDLLRNPPVGACRTSHFTLLPPERPFTRPLRLGDTGEDVRVLQKFLNANGFLLGTSGAGAPAEETPYFLARTNSALRYFQNAFGLTSERGKVGPKNRLFINNLLSNPPVLKCPTLIPASKLLEKDLAYGQRDPDVVVLQTFLNVNSFLLNVSTYGSRTQETSFFGPYTRASLTRFQIAFDLLAERNRLGPVTRKFINDLRLWGKTETPTEKTVPAAGTAVCSAYLNTYIRAGQANDPEEVRKLQVFLRQYEGFADVQSTGTYDAVTQRAVIAFQERYRTDVLGPWNTTGGTAYVFRTTQKKINDLFCEYVARR